MLEDELYLVPFAVLRASQDGSEYLSERCSLLTVSSLQTLRQKSRWRVRNQPENINSALVVGGPRVPTSVSDSLGWSESAASLQEATMVADMLQAKALIGSNATKENVLAELPTAECVHFAANLNWKMRAVVLSPSDMLDAQTQKRFYPNASIESENDDEGNDLSGSGLEIPSLNDFVLSAGDISSMKLNAKLIVLSSYNSNETVNAEAIVSLANSWLNAGAGAVLLSLWPVPETAAKILLKAFYSALLQGARAAK